MARILVVYGTTHRHTAKVAVAIAETLRQQGKTVDVHDASLTQPQPDDYDGVVVAASVHAGKYQRPLVRWVQAHRAALNSKPTAFVSVCLGVLQRDLKVHRELAEIVDR